MHGSFYGFFTRDSGPSTTGSGESSDKRDSVHDTGRSISITYTRHGRPPAVGGEVWKCCGVEKFSMQMGVAEPTRGTQQEMLPKFKYLNQIYVHFVRTFSGSEFF